MGHELTLSSLGHTWILDLDGTVVKHNGYKLDGEDSFLPGAPEFLRSLPEKDMIVFLTSRGSELREETELFLRKNGIRFDAVLYNAPYGERILINDRKPSGLRMSYEISPERDCWCDLTVREDEHL